MFERGDGHQDADEEDQRAHVDTRERMNQGEVMPSFAILLAMNEIGNQPQDSQPEENSHEWRQMGHGLNTGTHTRTPIPRKNTRFRSNVVAIPRSV